MQRLFANTSQSQSDYLSSAPEVLENSGVLYCKSARGGKEGLVAKVLQIANLYVWKLSLHIFSSSIEFAYLLKTMEAPDMGDVAQLRSGKTVLKGVNNTSNKNGAFFQLLVNFLNFFFYIV